MNVKEWFRYRWPTVFKGDPKALFSIATSPRCRVRHYYFLWNALCTLDPYFIMLSVKQGNIKYHFLVFSITRPGIESRSPAPLTNTLPTMPLGRFRYIFIHLKERETKNGYRHLMRCNGSQAKQINHYLLVSLVSHYIGLVPQLSNAS